jgi:hypothetical protein
MTKHDDEHVRLGAPRPGRGGGRRRLVVKVGIAAAASAAALLAVQVFKVGPLDPRDPSDPSAGVLAGRVAEVPPDGAPQNEVVLRFVGEGGRYDVPTRQGGAFAFELPAGTYTLTDPSGQGVCPAQVKVRAGGWRRMDVLWPCVVDSVPADAPPAPPSVPLLAPPGG